MLEAQFGSAFVRTQTASTLHPRDPGGLDACRKEGFAGNHWPQKIKQFFQQNMSDGFCFGKVDTDCCLLPAFTAMPCKVSCSQTVEYVNT